MQKEKDDGMSLVPHASQWCHVQAGRAPIHSCLLHPREQEDPQFVVAAVNSQWDDWGSLWVL